MCMAVFDKMKWLSWLIPSPPVSLYDILEQEKPYWLERFKLLQEQEKEKQRIQHLIDSI